MSHKFFCALNKTGTFKNPNRTIFIDLKESSLDDKLRSSFEWIKLKVEKSGSDLPLKKLSKSVEIPSAVEQYVWKRVFSTLSESNISAPMNGFHEGSAEIKRINGKNKCHLKSAILSYLRGKQAIFALHSAHPIDTSSGREEVGPVVDQSSGDTEMDTAEVPHVPSVESDPELEPSCTNASCVDRIKALELEVQRLKTALMKSRKRLKVTT